MYTTPLAFRLKFLSHELIHRQIPSKYLEEAYDRVVVGMGPKGKSVKGLRDITRIPHCLWLIVSPTIMEVKTNPVPETKFFQVLPIFHFHRGERTDLKTRGWSYVLF